MPGLPPGPRHDATPGLARPAPLQRYLYLAFAVALVPLVFSLLSTDDEAEFTRRIEKTITAHAGEFQRITESAAIKEIVGQLPPGTSQEQINAVVFSASFNKLMEEVPGAKVAGAHLPRDTWMHWAYALLAAAGFLGVVMLIFERGKVSAKSLVLTGLFTGTLGIVFLLAVQWVAVFTQGFWLRGRGIITLLFYILKFIGFSYRSALDPANGFFLSFLGFTCGVGLCEELAKAVPVLFHYKVPNEKGTFGWRGACVIGLASGIGFGVSEGITYSSDFYNGYHTTGIYVVRFVSCVALHAVWSAAVGVMIYGRRNQLKGRMDWGDWGKFLVMVLGVPMVLHGLYDTMLKKEMNGLALLTAVASFAFLVWVVERARREEAGSPGVPAAARV